MIDADYNIKELLLKGTGAELAISCNNIYAGKPRLSRLVLHHQTP